MAETLTHEAFRKHLGAKFEVEFEPEKSITLELIEVSELKQLGRQEEFSIAFLGPNETFLGQGTKPIACRAAGRESSHDDNEHEKRRPGADLHGVPSGAGPGTNTMARAGRARDQ